ncbi:MAG: hypothetical protein KatS3mg076_2527 [Candidatus Binatia bacterium]|nr:MAG: hypothetical protein KatS3mg076_2527 [Candidatus Binatia bacterium]
MKARAPKRWVLALFLGASSVLAHEGHTHKVLGVVRDVTADAIVVEESSGKKVTVLLGEKTRYRKGEKAATRDEIHVGDRIAVEAKTAEGKLVAEKVRLPSGK